AEQSLDFGGVQPVLFQTKLFYLRRDRQHSVVKPAHDFVSNTMFARTQYTQVAPAGDQYRAAAQLGDRTCPQVRGFVKRLDNRNFVLLYEPANLPGDFKGIPVVGFL